MLFNTLKTKTKKNVAIIESTNYCKMQIYGKSESVSLSVVSNSLPPCGL